jgi:hypothetical protein
MQLLDLGAHLLAQRGVEVGQRLVEQESLGRRTMARPIATRWRWPPESALGGARAAAQAERLGAPRIASVTRSFGVRRSRRL